jgi:hypothetical protein
MSLQFNDIPGKTIFGCYCPLPHRCEGILKRLEDSEIDHVVDSLYAAHK